MKPNPTPSTETHDDQTIDREDPAAPADNIYAAHHRAAAPDLDRNVPEMSSNELQCLNRSALGLLAGIVLLLAVVTFWLLRSSGTTDTSAMKQREEAVSVPDAPIGPGMAGAVRMTAPSGAPAIPLRPDPQSSKRDAHATQTSLSARQEHDAPRPHVPTLLERRIAAANAGGGFGTSEDGESSSRVGGVPALSVPTYGLPGMPGLPGTPAAEDPDAIAPNLAYSAKPLAATSTAAPLQHPDTLMLRGTFIRCVLETRIITDHPGFTACRVTEPVYSFTGKRLLLPKGSKVLGKYEMEPNGPRLAVIWDRIVTPTGIDVNMASPGVDTLGGAGHPGHYSAHWGSRIGAAMLISLMSDAFKYAAAEHGPPSTTITNGVVTQSPFESNTAETIQQVANQAVRRQANRPATVTINQGTLLAVYVAKDVDFADVIAR